MEKKLERVSTTFWQDFTIADAFGMDAIKDTFNRAFKELKHDIRYMAELYIVLNHKIWQHYDNGNMVVAKLYDTLWKQINIYVYEEDENETLIHYTREELDFFFDVTD